MNLCVAGLICALACLTQSDSIDPCGGIRFIRGDATGWFRLQQLQRRQMLITLDNPALVALGVNHISERDSHKVRQQWRDWVFNTVGYNLLKEYIQEK